MDIGTEREKEVDAHALTNTITMQTYNGWLDAHEHQPASQPANKLHHVLSLPDFPSRIAACTYSKSCSIHRKLLHLLFLSIRLYCPVIHIVVVLPPLNKVSFACCPIPLSLIQTQTVGISSTQYRNSCWFLVARWVSCI